MESKYSLAEDNHKHITLRFVTVFLNVLNSPSKLKIVGCLTGKMKIVTDTVKKSQSFFRRAFMSTKEGTRREE